ncbi:MAG: hypothetical protein VX761_01950 [Planctomycetota bacterium]|nr:hypothetical protein [Planctomycetota bacterium]
MAKDSLFNDSPDDQDLDEQVLQPTGVHQDLVQYRSVSKLAVVATVVSVLSLLAILDFSFWWFLPATGTTLGLLALRVTTQFEQHISGKRLALIGFALNITIFVVGGTLFTIEYLTEVP